MTQYSQDSNYSRGKTSILDIGLENRIILSVFPGDLSPNDILLRYKDLSNRITSNQYRTPRHAHWAVDLMLKREHDSQLTNELLREFQTQWHNTIPLTNRNYTTIINGLYLSRDANKLAHYSPLNSYGFYNIDFIMHLMELLMIQEKTNYPGAFMFLRVLDELLIGNDLFKMLSTVTHNGR